MKNLFLFLFIFFLLFSASLRADYLNTKDNSCIYDIEPYPNKSGLCYFERDKNKHVCDKNLQYSDLIDGYEIRNGKCILLNDLISTGLTQDEFNYFMAVIANVIGFTMLFLINFLSVLIARK